MRRVDLLGGEKLGATGSGWRLDKEARQEFPGLPEGYELLKTDTGGRRRILVMVIEPSEAEGILASARASSEPAEA